MQVKRGILVVFSSEQVGAVYEQGQRTMKENIAEREEYVGIH